MMEHPTLSPEMLVADLLAASPLAVETLIKLRVDCVGCSLNRFCTLKEMCSQYDLEIDSVLKQLCPSRSSQPMSAR
jgi:hybrid cluster-associated redox disulfide protein